MKIAGIDVSRGSVTVIVLSEIPDDIRKLRRKAVKLKANAEGIATLLEMEFDCAVLEPTGMHYSKIWVHHIRQSGREIRWVGHQEVASYRQSWRINNKTDELDAIALACYGLERYARPTHFIQAEGEALRYLWLQLQHYNRAKNPIVNRLRQQLCSEFPEAAERVVKRPWLNPEPPGLWKFIGGEEVLTIKKWQSELHASIGLGLSEFTRGLARNLCEIERQECAVEVQIEEELNRPEYQWYLGVFEEYGFGNRVSAAMLSAIYPFSQFLKGGQQISEYVNTEKGRARRNRSLGAFKLSCGVGMVYYQSGDSQGWKPGGSRDIRCALWLWCKMTVIMSPREDLPKVAKLINYYKNGSTQVVNGEEKHFTPGIRNQKIMRVVRRMLDSLYKDLLVVSRNL